MRRYRINEFGKLYSDARGTYCEYEDAAKEIADRETRIRELEERVALLSARRPTAEDVHGWSTTGQVPTGQEENNG